MSEAEMSPGEAEVRGGGGPPRAIERNLVLVNQPGWQSVDDLNAVAAKVRWLDPTIGTLVVSADMPNSVSRKAAATRPTLVVSPGPLNKFQPVRGKIYQGRRIPKFEQLRILHAAGVPVPRTTYLQPDTKLDPALWGEFVIVKPTDIGSSSRGAGIQLMRTTRVRYVAPEDYPADHPGRAGPMVVQQYIDTGLKLTAYRVSMFFDEPISCQRTGSKAERVPLTADDVAIENAIIATQGYKNSEKTKDFVFDADIIELARQAARAVPDVPLKGVDLVRDVRSGRAYVLEMNPGGNTWHFSSAFLAPARAEDPPEHNARRLAQFDAFSTVAHVLVERTRAEAQ